jgi:hypothetical protein
VSGIRTASPSWKQVRSAAIPNAREMFITANARGALERWNVQFTVLVHAPARRFTKRQGQYLAFHLHVHAAEPTAACGGRLSAVLPGHAPAVHQMIIELEKRGLISRIPGQPRTIKVTLPDDELPRLQPIKTSAPRY